MENFAEQLKAARKAAGMTQQGMEDTMQIPRRTVQDWEKGKMVPPPYVQRLVLKELERKGDGYRAIFATIDEMHNVPPREEENMTPDERKRQEDRVRERRKINSYAPLEALEKIAKENIPGLSIRVLMHGLDTMDSDDLDFFETSVWSIKEALIEAYLLGKKDAERD